MTSRTPQKPIRAKGTLRFGAPCAATHCTLRTEVSEILCSALSKDVIHQPFETGATLPLDGSSETRTIAVGDGTVRIEWLLDDGRRQVLGFYFRGDVLSSPLVSPEIQAIAITPGVLYHVDAATIDACRDLRDGPIDHQRANLAEDLSVMARRTLMLGQFSAREKLAAFLIDLAERIGKRTGEGISVEITMSRHDIADFLGLNPETVSRTFSRLKTDRLIVLPKPDRALIVDRRGLQNLIPEHAQYAFEPQPDVA